MKERCGVHERPLPLSYNAMARNSERHSSSHAIINCMAWTHVSSEFALRSTDGICSDGIHTLCNA